MNAISLIHLFSGAFADAKVYCRVNGSPFSTWVTKYFPVLKYLQAWGCLLETVKKKKKKAMESLLDYLLIYFITYLTKQRGSTLEAVEYPELMTKFVPFVLHPHF